LELCPSGETLSQQPSQKLQKEERDKKDGVGSLMNTQALWHSEVWAAESLMRHVTQQYAG
jgi:hypothetical protein